jgi:two-component system osmolarity sensor histidine kinase EnvZ
MRLVPRTLQARIVLLILLLLATGQVAALRIFHHFELEPRAAALALQVVSTVNLTRLALLAAQDDRRPELLQELNRSEGIRVYPFDPLEDIEPLPNDPLVQRMAEKVRESLGINTMIAINHLNVRGLWVSFGIGLDDYWVVIPSVNTERPFPWEWLGWGALVTVLSLFGAWFIMGRINRPLTELALAADAIGRGERIGRLEESGSSEFARVTHAINEMNEALARAENDRNLLLAGISHDLRTPLSRLRLAVEMLPETDDLKAGMTQDIEDMDAIIGQFLDFIRGGSGEEGSVNDLNALVTEVAERYRREGKWPILDLGALPDFHFRRLALTRLLANLIDNAFHYGKEPVIVRTRVEGEMVVLSVIDHGPGLPEIEVERLMRPFERLDAARGREGASGLGLSIAARIARLHGGHLLLRNREGGGLEARAELAVVNAG